jgi:hypothetical protein
MGYLRQTLKVIGNCALATAAALSVGACMLAIGDAINQYEKKAIISKYQDKSAEEIQRMIKTLKEAGDFIRAFYGPNSKCLDGARAIAYMIADDNYKPEIITLTKEGISIHWICIYHENNKIRAEDNGLSGSIKPYNDTIKDLVKKLGKRKHMSLDFEYAKGLLEDESYMDAKGLENILKMLDREKR